MTRVVEPEILDDLKPDDPRAVRARRDLRRINFWMANAGIIARSLRGLAQRPKRLVELGAGDGTLLLRVARKLAWREPIELILLDREPAVDRETLDAYSSMGWKPRIVPADLFDWLKSGHESDCILANLFLHHFQESQLRTVFSQAALQTGALIACEPPRSARALASCRLMPLIGIGEVALYDARVSIRAGFRDRELSELWPQTEGWKLRETSAGLFSHLFVAERCAM